MTGALLAAAVEVEARKLLAARVVWATTSLLVAGIAILAGTTTLAVRSGNEQVAAKLGPTFTGEGWHDLVSVATQVTSAAALLGFGVVLSWIIGREFADRTIGGLYCLPVSRPVIATAKVVVFLVWSVAVSVGLVAVTVLLGFALGLGAPGGDDVDLLLRLLVLACLSGLLALPAAWASTIGRGLLPGIGLTVVLIVAAQVLVTAGAGSWFPAAAPALWALGSGDAGVAPLALVPLWALVFALLTARGWSRLQLDR